MVDFVPLKELTDEQWSSAWETMYSPRLSAYLGVDPNVTANKPSLVDFYANIMAAHAAGQFMAWAIIRDGEYVGHTILDKSTGEWELGTVLADAKLWGTGLGVRASMHAARWAFEDNKANWLVAFTQGKDPFVRRILAKAGFKRLMHFWVLDADTWRERWGTKEDEA